MTAHAQGAGRAPGGAGGPLPLELSLERSFVEHAPPGRAMWLLRLALALAVLVGLLLGATVPAERHVVDLLSALERGTVTAVRIERPPAEQQPSGNFRVEWDTDGGRSAYAYYEMNLGGDPQADEGAEILAGVDRSPREVDVVVDENLRFPTGTTWDVTAIAGLGALALLLVGPRTRLATRWAWFWLVVVVASPVVPLAFVLLEPVPLWVRRTLGPAGRRLTGGWALLLAFLLGPAVRAAVESNVEWLVWGWR